MNPNWIKKGLFLVNILLVHRGFTQCPYPARLEGNNSCVGATLSVVTTHTLGKIVWYRDNTPIDSAMATRHIGSVVSAAGGQPIPNTFFPGPTTLVTPLDFIVLDDAGNIYLTDDSNLVAKWTAATNSWSVAAGGNGAGNASNQLRSPRGLRVDGQGNIYIADYGNHRVQKWAPGADTGITVAGIGGEGDGPDQLEDPVDIAIDCAGNIYVADSYYARIQKWAPGAVNGTTVAGGNGEGIAANQLNHPTGLWLDGNNNLYIADGFNDRIQKWAPGASSGITVASSSNGHYNTTTLFDPGGFFVDYTGNIYTSNQASPDRIIQWAPGDTTGTAIYTGSIGNVFSSFMDSKGNIFGIRTKDNHLQELQQTFTIDNTYKTTTGGKYYAILTDVNGYFTTTDTFTVFAPSSPSPIQISASATAVTVCTPVSFIASPSYPTASASYQWQVSGVDVGGDSATWSNNLFANGDRVVCILTTADNSCNLVKDTSNAIIMSVDPQGHPTVTIAASDTSVCAGLPITFLATVVNGSAAPAFQWLVNGQPLSGDSSSTFTSSSLASGDVIDCLITSDASCGLAKSNSIPIAVYPLPTIAPEQTISIPYGKTETLDPAITGNILSYTWTPGSYLSDSTILDPVASPPTSTQYTLKLLSLGGCQASGTIIVDVYTPLSLPNAFTPNGDGRNDILYVLGGPAGSQIRQFAIFDRWGASVFEAHNALPGDPRAGWNGNGRGGPAPAGTYVYVVVMAMADGTQKVYKGTVLLVR